VLHSLWKFEKEENAHEKKFIREKGEKQAQLYRADYLTEALGAKIRQFIEQVLQEEIDIMIRAGHYHGSLERTGYRHGHWTSNIRNFPGFNYLQLPPGQGYLTLRALEGNGSPRYYLGTNGGLRP
jgi:hypothetical protein